MRRMDAKLIGNVSVDGAEIALLDSMYVLTDEDHDQGREAAEVLPGYDGVVVSTGKDGVFPVFLDLEDGVPARIRVELR